MKPNPIEIVPAGCPVTIEVGRNSIYGPLLALIDAEDYQKVAGKTIGIHYNPEFIDTDGIRHPESYSPVLESAKPKTFLRRLILGITDPNVKVRHKNGNALDCRKSNLEALAKGEPK